MIRDKFGRPENSINFGNETFTAVEWDDTSVSGCILLRGSYEDNCLIMKVDTVNKKITYAYGEWASRTNLTYGTDQLMS